MLTIRAARAPGYYENAEFARDDYYAEAGEVPGVWVGRGSESLGLGGPPRRGELGGLLDGVVPGVGVRLPGLREGRRNVGWDLTWTAPKSVSVLHAVGGEMVGREVRLAHEAGVRAGLDYLERFECQARRGAQGVRIVSAGGFAGAGFTHELSRSGDPHLHTHLVVVNAVLGPDGRWSAPDMRPVFAAAKTAGTIAEAVMRQELSRRLGVRWGPVVNGTAEIQGMGKGVLVEFSRRRVELQALAHVRGVDSLAGVGAAQRETRDHKPNLDRAEAIRDWTARAGEHGLGRTEVRALLGRSTHVELTADQVSEVGVRLAGPEGLTGRVSTFDRRAVIRGFAEGHQAGTSLARIEALTDAWVETHGVPVLPTNIEVGQRASWTTHEMLGVEERLITTATRAGSGVRIPGGFIDQVLTAHPEAGLDQAAAVRALAGGVGPVRVMVAGAGTGKTYTLGLTQEALTAARIQVLGCAWQGQAAQVLQAEAGIRSVTIASLIGRITRDPDTALPRGSVLVIDEAGTVPTRALAPLLEYAAERRVTVLMVGDPRQLPSIDAGGALASLEARLGAVELTENRRQQTALQRDIAADLAAGHPDKAISRLEGSGRFTAYSGVEDARKALITEWSKDGLRDPSRALILAHDRVDVSELNRLAREVMHHAGLLSPERLTANDREWAAGDRLVCRRNEYRRDIDVRNGTRGVVTEVHPSEMAFTVRTDDGRTVRLPKEYLEHVHHGYAVTAHVSQGATTDRTYLLATADRGGREWGYVAGSRHRIDLHVFAHHPGNEQPASAIARGWTRTQAKTLAIDLIQKPGLETGRTPARDSGRPPRETGKTTDRPQGPATGHDTSAQGKQSGSGFPDPTEAARRILDGLPRLGRDRPPGADRGR